MPEPSGRIDPLALYQELGEYERHFNNLQHQYRGFAATWLAAAGAAIGYIVKESENRELNYLFAAGVGFAASVGICLLWMVDARVYHQLLRACIEQAEELEHRHPGLFAARHAMREFLGAPARHYAAVFYGAGFAITASLATGALASHYSAARAPVAGGLGLLLLGATAVAMWMGWRVDHPEGCGLDGNPPCRPGAAVSGGVLWAGGVVAVALGVRALGTPTWVGDSVLGAAATFVSFGAAYFGTRRNSPRHPPRPKATTVDIPLARSSRP